jgi:hypothetical protein
MPRNPTRRAERDPRAMQRAAAAAGAVRIREIESRPCGSHPSRRRRTGERLSEPNLSETDIGEDPPPGAAPEHKREPPRRSCLRGGSIRTENGLALAHPVSAPDPAPHPNREPPAARDQKQNRVDSVRHGPIGHLVVRRELPPHGSRAQSGRLPRVPVEPPIATRVPWICIPARSRP